MPTLRTVAQSDDERTDEIGVTTYTMSSISKARGSSYASGALRALVFIARATLLLELKINICCCED